MENNSKLSKESYDFFLKKKKNPYFVRLECSDMILFTKVTFIGTIHSKIQLCGCWWFWTWRTDIVYCETILRLYKIIFQIECCSAAWKKGFYCWRAGGGGAQPSGHFSRKWGKKLEITIQEKVDCINLKLKSWQISQRRLVVGAHKKIEFLLYRDFFMVRKGAFFKYFSGVVLDRWSYRYVLKSSEKV